MNTMNWSKAGRPKTKVGNMVVSDLIQDESSEDGYDKSSEDGYDKSELTIYNYGYVALALAVIKQCKKDNVNINSISSIYTDCINCYVEEFTKKLCPTYNVGKDEEGSNG